MGSVDCHNRLILVPQMPVDMRYTSWWIAELDRHLSKFYKDFVILGRTLPSHGDLRVFAPMDLALQYELEQMEEYMKLDVTENDVLLNCDLSYPGLFHTLLFHRRPGRAVAFCHATARNRYDIFTKVRQHKWLAERAAAGLYDSVLVASDYHMQKLRWPNLRCTNGLPLPPAYLLPTKAVGGREFLMGSVSRPCRQKVDRRVEGLLEETVGRKVHRFHHPYWKEYYTFLDRVKYLIITASEETFGYQVMDALLRGCTPIAPRCFSYPELLPDWLLYDASGTSAQKADCIAEIVGSGKTYNDPDKPAAWSQNFYLELIRALKGK